MKNSKIYNELIICYLFYLDRYIEKRKLDRLIGKSKRTYQRYIKELKDANVYLVCKYGTYNGKECFYIRYSGYDQLTKFKGLFNRIEKKNNKKIKKTNLKKTLLNMKDIDFNKWKSKEQNSIVNYFNLTGNERYLNYDNDKREYFNFDYMRIFMADTETMPDDIYYMFSEKSDSWEEIQEQILNNQFISYLIHKKESIKHRLFRVAILLMFNINNFNYFVGDGLEDGLFASIEEASKYYKFEDPMGLYTSGQLSKRTYFRDKKLVLNVLKLFADDYIEK